MLENYCDTIEAGTSFDEKMSAHLMVGEEMIKVEQIIDIEMITKRELACNGKIINILSKTLF